MPCTKDAFLSEQEANEKLAQVKAAHKRHGHGGKSWKRLISYQCGKCRLWHHGRDNTERLQKLREITNSQPVKKFPALATCCGKRSESRSRWTAKGSTGHFSWAKLSSATTSAIFKRHLMRLDGTKNRNENDRRKQPVHTLICQHVFQGAVPELVIIEDSEFAVASCFACADKADQMSPEESGSLFAPAHRGDRAIPNKELFSIGDHFPNDGIFQLLDGKYERQPDLPLEGEA